MKRTQLFDRLIDHQSRMEQYFKVFYDTLDEVRQKVLKQEYRIGAEIEAYETELKALL